MRKPAVVACVGICCVVLTFSFAIAKSVRRSGAASAHLAPAAFEAMKRIDAEHIRAHVFFLSHDLLEGRGTGQRGGDIAGEDISRPVLSDPPTTPARKRTVF